MLLNKSLYFLVLCLLSTALAQGQISKDKAIEYVKNLSPSMLDSNLTKGHFSDWLARILGQKTKVKWELEDCGEQTGNPAIDNERDLPICVGVYAKFADGRNIGITILIGMYNKGVSDPAAVYDIYLEYQGQSRTIKHLSGIQKALEEYSR